MTYDPTDEQLAALKLFSSGDDMVIEAGAGTGKTSTLRLLAESTGARGQYLAFNKAIVADASASFPDTVSTRTNHSLAMSAYGRPYAHRLGGGRVSPYKLARMLNLNGFTVWLDDTEKRYLKDWQLASVVRRAIERFCRTADRELSVRHFEYIEGVDYADDDGKRTYANNNLLAEYLLPYAQSYWADVNRPNGQMPFTHDCYLKMWQLSDPHVDVDYFLLDEAQDMNPVMSAIIAAQDHTQRIYVGDTQQQIYRFTGAVNAMDGFSSDHRVFLTKSFRFGTAIAARANSVLDEIPSATLRLVGFEDIDSSVLPLTDATCILTRTNAGAVGAVLSETRRGRSVHLVKGANDIAAFARAARNLMDGRDTHHPDLSIFTSWSEVLDFVAHDEDGSELAPNVNLIERYGVETVIEATENRVSEEDADVVVSTAHKSKGRQWSTVQIGADFPPEIKDTGDRRDDEYRLMYVAVTRAQHVLDDFAIASHYTDYEPEGVEL